MMPTEVDDLAGTEQRSTARTGQDGSPGSALYRLLRIARIRRFWQHGSDLELLHRSMGFAALGFVTLVPLLVLVAAINPFHQQAFGEWLVGGMGLSGRSADAVRQLFATPRNVLSTTSVFSVVALALFGLSFAASVQTGYEKIWGLSASQLNRVWRQAVWLVFLTAYLYMTAQSTTVSRKLHIPEAVGIALVLLLGILFFWWSQHFLLDGVVSWGRLLPGALATVGGLVGLRLFSTLVFEPLIVSNAVTYGIAGIVLIVVSWLIGAGFVVFGGALLGHHLHQDDEPGAEAQPTTEPMGPSAD